MRVSKAIRISISGYFLVEEIVNYFEIKKCSEMLICAAFGSRNRFSTAKFGFKAVMLRLGQKKGAVMEITARINPISYEKPSYKRNNLSFSL